MEKIAEMVIDGHYFLVINFDSLREIFFNIYRGRDELYNRKYYFSSFNGHVDELELLIDEQNPLIPRVLENLRHLRRLYIYANDLGFHTIKFNLYLESLVHLKIFCFGRVVLPNVFKIFPNLKLIEIYGDISGLTQKEVDNGTMEKLNTIRHNFRHIILKELVNKKKKDLKFSTD